MALQPSWPLIATERHQVGHSGVALGMQILGPARAMYPSSRPGRANGHPMNGCALASCEALNGSWRQPWLYSSQIQPRPMAHQVHPPTPEAQLCLSAASEARPWRGFVESLGLQIPQTQTGSTPYAGWSIGPRPDGLPPVSLGGRHQ